MIHANSFVRIGNTSMDGLTDADLERFEDLYSRQSYGQIPERRRVDAISPFLAPLASWFG
jgi:hypothetical protein